MASPCELLCRADRATAERLLQIAAAEAWRIEAKFSRYLSGNIVDRINSADGAAVEVDEETAQLLDFAETLHELSEGLFDITSGFLRKIWKFDGSGRVPGSAQVERALESVGWSRVAWNRPTLKMMPGMQLDFGGIGKEYAVDRAAALVAAHSRAPCVINFGGDLAVIGANADDLPWSVGIESVDSASQLPVTRIRITRGGLATSGDSRRFLLKDGVRYGHLLSPVTGWPVVNAPRSVTVAADTCTQAGMLASIAMLKGADAERFLENHSVRFWCARGLAATGNPGAPV